MIKLKLGVAEAVGSDDADGLDDGDTGVAEGICVDEGAADDGTADDGATGLLSS